MKAYDATIQIKTLQQYFHMVLSISLGFNKKKLIKRFCEFSFPMTTVVGLKGLRTVTNGPEGTRSNTWKFLY